MSDESPNPVQLHEVPAEAPTFRFLWYAGQWPATIRALRHRNFRYFWSGQFISLIGTWMQSAAQGWLVLVLAIAEFGEANAAFYVGMIGALGSAPIFLLTLFAGVISDRHDRRRILVLTQTLLMLLAIGLGLLVSAGAVRLWHVGLFSLLTGAAMAFDMPTRQAFVKDMASPEDLLNAIALNSSIFNLARIVGPGVAGWLMSIQAIGIPGVLYINAASYLAVIAGLLAIRNNTLPRQSSAGSLWHHLGEGFRYVIEHRIIRLLMVIMAVYSIFGFSYAVLLSVVANQVLGQQAAGYGYLLTAGGVGAFIGAIYLASTARYVRKGRVLLLGSILFTLALLAFSLSHSYYLSLLLLPVVGGGLVVASASINSLIQEIVPDRLRGRVVSMWAFIFAGSTPIGALYAGTVAHYTSPLTAVMLGGVICLVAVVVISLRAGWLWNLE